MNAADETSISPRRPWRVIAWWEKRRIIFNLAVFAAGIISISVVEFIGGRLAHPGEDMKEPLGLILGVVVYGIAANICYTLGWTTELIWRGSDRNDADELRRKVFRRGMIFSIALTLLPSVLIPIMWLIFGFHHQRP